METFNWPPAGTSNWPLTHARGNPDDGLREAVEAMIADYTDDPGRYSDGSEVWEWYEEFPGYYFATKGELHLPPHRRTEEKPGHTFRHGLLTPMPAPLRRTSVST